MYETNSHRIDNRLVLFGAKLSIAVANGIAFIDTLHLVSTVLTKMYTMNFKYTVEKNSERFKRYLQRILVDKMYRNLKNIQWCKGKGIRMLRSKLG